jgi:DNA-binding transcriptional MocR family regulator
MPPGAAAVLYLCRSHCIAKSWTPRASDAGKYRHHRRLPAGVGLPRQAAADGGRHSLVTAPTYLGALQAFAAYEPRYDTLRPEQTNRTPGSYREAARNAATDARVKFAYVVLDFANPTGETLSAFGRTTLLDLAEVLDIPVIEDTAYHALRFEGEDLPAL